MIMRINEKRRNGTSTRRGIAEGRSREKGPSVKRGMVTWKMTNRAIKSDRISLLPFFSAPRQRRDSY